MRFASNYLSMLLEDHDAVNRAFSKQAAHFDEDDLANVILQDLRQQVYRHVDGFLSPGSRILELNAGTGLDAVRFVKAGHYVHATDLSDGMIGELKKKKAQPGMERLSIQQLSFENIEHVQGENYDLVFSNFGGLNCAKDLSPIGEKLHRIIKPGGFVSWVILPVVSPWEVATVLRGNRHAFRRWNSGGTQVRLEGEEFPVWYYSKSSVKRALRQFKLVRSEGIASLSPPPYKAQFARQYPRLYKILRRLDTAAGTSFPFNRWADHLVLTFRKR
jgi:ubiquinone/menaquinone biosynthesis C-methylase UbiE